MQATTIAGIFAGLSVAFFQSLSYLATRHYMQKGTGGNRRLLVLSHVWMGVISAALLPFFWPKLMPRAWDVFEPLLLSLLFYLVGQTGLLVSLKWAEPSQVSPMLAFKLVILGLMVHFLGGTPLSGLQWAAVVLCVGGGVVLHTSGGVGRGKAALAVATTCIAYSCSDWNLNRLLIAFQGRPWGQSLVFPTLLAYATSGLIGLAFLPMAGSRRWSDWREAAPFGLAWLAAMLCLAASFALVGLVAANILQSTRGLMSVAMGSALAAMGLLHFEKAAGRGVFLRRLLAAIMMCGAVVLYMLGKS